MRSKFDEQLMNLHQALVSMGGLCENAIAASVKSLQEKNIKLAKSVTELSMQIDQRERDIESMCMKLLLQQQPVARDLRSISAALKMVTDLQRIGHNSGDIAEIVTVANISDSYDLSDISEMAIETIHMVTESIDAFVKGDAALAGKVVEYDDIVDSHFDKIKYELIKQLKEPECSGEMILDILMIAKYFERIGDHAENIAKWVIFSIEGKRE